MEQKVNPCRKDCPLRAADCHVTCSRYRAFREDRQKEYSRRERERALNEAQALRGRKIRWDVRQRGLNGTRRRR